MAITNYERAKGDGFIEKWFRPFVERNWKLITASTGYKELEGWKQDLTWPEGQICLILMWPPF